MARSRVTEVLVGSGALVLGAVFLVWAFTGGGLLGEEGYRVTARFQEVDGLTVGSEVRMAGIVVGHVRQMEYDPEAFQAVVTLMIDDEVEVPVDTSASVVQNGVLSDKYIDLSPGGSFDTVQPGGELRYTQNSVLVIDILERIVRDAERRRSGGNANDAAE